QQTVAADRNRLASTIREMQATAAKSSREETSSSANTLRQQLEADLLAAGIHRTQLLLKFEATYPLVREVDQEIAEIHAAIEKAQGMRYTSETSDRDPTYELLR